MKESKILARFKTTAMRGKRFKVNDSNHAAIDWKLIFLSDGTNNLHESYIAPTLCEAEILYVLYIYFLQCEKILFLAEKISFLVLISVSSAWL